MKPKKETTYTDALKSIRKDRKKEQERMEKQETENTRIEYVIFTRRKDFQGDLFPNDDGWRMLWGPYKSDTITKERLKIARTTKGYENNEFKAQKRTITTEDLDW